MVLQTTEKVWTLAPAVLTSWQPSTKIDISALFAMLYAFFRWNIVKGAEFTLFITVEHVDM